MRKVLLEGWQKGCHSGQLKQPFAVLSSWVMADYSHKNHETYMLLQSLKADEHYHWFKVCFSMSLWLLSFWKMLPKQVHNWEKKTVFGSKKVAQKWAKQKTHKIQPFKNPQIEFHGKPSHWNCFCGVYYMFPQTTLSWPWIKVNPPVHSLWVCRQNWARY